MRIALLPTPPLLKSHVFVVEGSEGKEEKFPNLPSLLLVGGGGAASMHLSAEDLSTRGDSTGLRRRDTWFPLRCGLRIPPVGTLTATFHGPVRFLTRRCV